MHFSRNRLYCTVMLAVVHAVLGLPLPDFLVIDPKKLNTL